MNGNCDSCRVEKMCIYAHKPCECRDYLKFVPGPGVRYCDSCKGTGEAPYPFTCLNCNGTGLIQEMLQ